MSALSAGHVVVELEALMLERPLRSSSLPPNCSLSTGSCHIPAGHRCLVQKLSVHQCSASAEQTLPLSWASHLGLGACGSWQARKVEERISDHLWVGPRPLSEDAQDEQQQQFSAWDNPRKAAELF